MTNGVRVVTNSDSNYRTAWRKAKVPSRCRTVRAVVRGEEALFFEVGKISWDLAWKMIEQNQMHAKNLIGRVAIRAASMPKLCDCWENEKCDRRKRNILLKEKKYACWGRLRRGSGSRGSAAQPRAPPRNLNWKVRYRTFPWFFSQMSKLYRARSLHAKFCK